MSYRTGTYVAFHANGTSEPTETDMKYYRLLTAWHENEDFDFEMINSHDKTAAVRDSSKKETLVARLKERLNKSKNMILIIGETTRQDTDWIPFEIQYAVDSCNIPIIATYTAFRKITNPQALSSLWPAALSLRISNGTARAIHIPFKMEPLKAAIKQFHHLNLPNTPLNYYNEDAYNKWGIT